MNQDTQRTVLTTAQRLDLDYWEAFMLTRAASASSTLKRCNL